MRAWKAGSISVRSCLRLLVSEALILHEDPCSGSPLIPHDQRGQVPAKQANGAAALALLNAELSQRPFLCGKSVLSLTWFCFLTRMSVKKAASRWPALIIFAVGSAGLSRSRVSFRSIDRCGASDGALGLFQERKPNNCREVVVYGPYPCCSATRESHNCGFTQNRHAVVNRL